MERLALARAEGAASVHSELGSTLTRTAAGTALGNATANATAPLGDLGHLPRPIRDAAARTTDWVLSVAVVLPGWPWLKGRSPALREAQIMVLLRRWYGVLRRMVRLENFTEQMRPSELQGLRPSPQSTMRSPAFASATKTRSLPRPRRCSIEISRPHSFEIGKQDASSHSPSSSRI